MKISLDGGQTFQDVPEVRIVFENIDVPGEDEPKGELHLNLKDDGIVTDVWCSREDSLDHNVASTWETIEQVVQRLVDEED